jgi:glycosyltransferase involved in cell wall biosynthesis
LPHVSAPAVSGADQAPFPQQPLTVLIVVPTVDVGAADEGAVELARVLAAAGHHPIVVSSGGRLEADLAAIGAELVRRDARSHNPLVIARNAAALHRLIRERDCHVVHAHARAPAWSAFLAARLAGVPFLTTCYAGFREQNVFKRWYNSVMMRGDRVVTASDQLAELIVERRGVPWDRISVIHSSVDLAAFDPASVTPERIDAVRATWGVKADTRVILVAGRLLRRKGHHVVVQAARRLKEMGLKDFLFVFDGEDDGRSRYSGELWDLVLATGTADVVRIAGPVADRPASFASATLVVSAAVQLEGLQRALLEGMAMERPVIASDLAAGPEAVLAPPAVSEDRMTGLRFPAGDDAALAAALIRFFSYPEAARDRMGRRAREWMRTQFDGATAAEQTLAVYALVCAPVPDQGLGGPDAR